MPYNPFAAPLRIEAGFSRRFALVTGMIHAVALVLLFPPDLPWWLKVLFFCAVCGSAWHSFYYHVLRRNPLLPRTLVMLDDYLMTDGEQEAEILGSSFVHPQLIVLNLKLHTGKRTRLVLFPDSLDKNGFRRLRVRLLHRLATHEDQWKGNN